MYRIRFAKENLAQSVTIPVDSYGAVDLLICPLTRLGSRCCQVCDRVSLSAMEFVMLSAIEFVMRAIALLAARR